MFTLCAFMTWDPPNMRFALQDRTRDRTHLPLRSVPGTHRSLPARNASPRQGRCPGPRDLGIFSRFGAVQAEHCRQGSQPPRTEVHFVTNSVRTEEVERFRWVPGIGNWLNMRPIGVYIYIYITLSSHRYSNSNLLYHTYILYLL